MDSPKKLSFILPFPPFANQETAFTNKGIAYTPAEKKKFMLDIVEYMEAWSGYFAGVPCIRLKVTCVCARPKLHPSHIPSGIWKTLSKTYYKATRPDGDNYLKPIQDTLGNAPLKTKMIGKTRIVVKRGAKIIDDDSCIVDTRCVKVYCRPDQEPQIIVQLKELPYELTDPTIIPATGKHEDFTLES